MGIGGTPIHQRLSSTTWRHVWKRFHGRSKLVTTATCTNWNLRSPSSPCTNESWPRFWPSGSSSTGDGARSGRLTWVIRYYVEMSRRYLDTDKSERGSCTHGNADANGQARCVV